MINITKVMLVLKDKNRDPAIYYVHDKNYQMATELAKKQFLSEGNSIHTIQHILLAPLTVIGEPTMKSDIYIPKYYEACELVTQATYEQFRDNPILIFRLFNPNVLRWADWMREMYGPMNCNNWWWGGNFDDRGLRTSDSDTGKLTSQHRIGNAIDLDPKEMSATEIIADLRIKKFVPFVTRIEDKPGMTWIHGDCKPTEIDETYFYLP